MTEPYSERVVAAHAVHSATNVATMLASGVGTECFSVSVCRRVVAIAIDLFRQGLGGVEAVRSVLVGDGTFDNELPQDLWAELVSLGWTDTNDAFQLHLGRVLGAHRARVAHDIMAGAVTNIEGGNLETRLNAVDRAREALLSFVGEVEDTVFSAADISDELLADLEERSAVTARVPTGFREIDDIIGGLMVGRVTTIAGGTSHGKSLFSDQIMLQIADRWASEGSDKVCVKFSCEDDRSSNKLRLVANLTHEEIPNGVPIEDITAHVERREELSAEKLYAVRAAARRLRKMNIIIDENSSPDKTYLRSRLMAARARNKIGLIVFDYLEFTGEKAQSKNVAIDQTMVALHEVSKQFGCPTIALSQLKEQASDRPSGLPSLADLSWSAFIKKISAQVLMVHSPWEHWIQSGQQGEEPDPRAFLVFVRKNKGRVGRATLGISRPAPRIVHAGPRVYIPE